MTSPERPPRLPAGTYIIQDSADERAISKLLARHHVARPDTTSPGGARARQTLRATERRLHELENSYEKTQELLARAVTDLRTARQLHNEAATEATELRNGEVGLQTDLAHAQKRIDELTNELARTKAAAAKKPVPRDSGTARAQDRAAFANLADRLDREAVSKSKTIGDVLRLAARAVREEIEAVYEPGRAAS